MARALSLDLRERVIAAVEAGASCGQAAERFLEPACWSYGCRKLFDRAKLTKAAIAVWAVPRIDEIFAIERTINGQAPAERLAMRQVQATPLIEHL